MNELSDQYLTIQGKSEGLFRDRGSKFLAYAFPLFSEEECPLHLEALRKEHPKARHHCYAYRIGLDGNRFRANDDGEPGGTAGRPILGQIDSFGLTNVLVVVVRYFGGTLLGASGLIQAYKQSAADALQNSQIVERLVESVFQLKFDYAHMSQVMNILKALDIELLGQDFGLEAQLQIAIRQTEVAKKLEKIKAAVAGVHLEMVPQLGDIPGFELEFLYTR